MAKQEVQVTGGSGNRARSRWLAPFEEMEREFERFFPRSWMQQFSEWPRLSERLGSEMRMPRVDILDQDKNLLVRAEIPGVKQEDIQVELTNNSLTLRASSKSEQEQKEGEYYRCEIGSMEFARSMNLPEEIDADNAKAVYKDGILEITLPKKAPAERKTLKVEGGGA